MPSSTAAVSPAFDSPPIHWCETTNKLRIDWTETLGYPCVLNISGWDDALNWQSIIYDEAEPADLLEEPGVDFLKPTDNPHINQWQQTLPALLLDQVSLVSRYKFLMLRLLNQWYEARDLMLSNPVLLWLWVVYCKENKLDEGELYQGVCMKQSKLLGRMGLPETASLARMLKRLDLDIWDDAIARKIHNLWACPQATNSLRHIPVIYEKHLNLLHHTPSLRGTPLFYRLADIECAWERREVWMLFRDCLYMGLTVDRELRHCRTEQSLRRIHDRHDQQRRQEIDQETQRRTDRITKDEDGNYLPFPPPPHPGTDKIKPITTAEALIEEGKEMKHCVGIYVSRVQKASVYIYRMYTPERLTISVTVREGKIFNVEQVKGASNEAASDEAKTLVEEWLVEVLRG